MLNINKTVNDSSAVVSLAGRLDTVTAPKLEHTLQEFLPEVTKLTLDFSGLEYLSSAGLRVLLFAQKTMSKRGHMKLTHVNEIIMDIFEVTGFSDILCIE